MQSRRVEEILGRNRRWENASKDTDKDGVSNILDCKPNDPRKQGIIHTIGRGAVRTFTKEGSPTREKLVSKIDESEEKSDKRKEFKKEKESEIKEASRDAFYSEKKKVAVQKAREKARSGGFLGQVGRAFNSATKPPKAKTVRRIVKTKTKSKGKTKKKKKSIKPSSKGGFDITKLKSIK